MSLALFFRGIDGVLIVADGREVFAAEAEAPDWRSDSARKVTSYSGPSPVVGAAIGLASVGKGEGAQDVLDLLDEVLSGARPSLGISAGTGPWTAKDVALEARNRAEERMEGLALGSSVVLGAVVDWQVDAPGPTMWEFELRAVDVLEPVDEAVPSAGCHVIRRSASMVREREDLRLTGFAALPESSRVWQVMRPEVDRSVGLLASGAASDDPRWQSLFRWSGLSISDIAERVSTALQRLQITEPTAFRTAHVGGVWIFVYLRPGQGPEFERHDLGPLQSDGEW